MKIFGSMLTALAIVVSANAQAQDAHLLDGRSFSVEAVSGPDVQLETPQNLIFKDGKADAPVCHMYGFYAADYQSYEVGDDIYFSFANESETEGRMVFNGKVSGDQLTGSYVWQKPGHEDLEYEIACRSDGTR